MVELPMEDELGHLANRQCRKRPVPSSSECQPVASPIARKKPRLEPAAADSMLGAPMTPKTTVGVQELLSAPAIATTPSGALVVPCGRGNTAPLHVLARRLQTQLQEWEEAVLPEAGRSLMRPKWRRMGLIQHKAKQVRKTWRASLSRLRREMLGEHSRGLGLLYAEAVRPKGNSEPQSLRSPRRPISGEHWLECDDIAHLWKALMHGASLDIPRGAPESYHLIISFIIFAPLFGTFYKNSL